MQITKKELALLNEITGAKKGVLSAQVVWIDLEEACVYTANRTASVRIFKNCAVALRPPFALMAEDLVAAMKTKGVTALAVSPVSNSASSVSVAAMKGDDVLETHVMQTVSDVTIDVDFAAVQAMWVDTLKFLENPENAPSRVFSLSVVAIDAIAKMSALSSEVTVVGPPEDGGVFYVEATTADSKAALIVQPVDGGK